jgi:hypothetical protein
MKDRLSLEIERGADDASPQVGVSCSITIAGIEGSKLSGSVLLIPKCASYRMLEQEISNIKKELDALLEKSQSAFALERKPEGPRVDEAMGAKEIWDILSIIEDPEALKEEFNSLSHDKRVEIADYVFAHCNVFSGVASVFSMRYNNQEAKLE